ncbi:MAG: histidine kinase dimerization/phosphoacceptor domain-containing protein [Nocardioides sp.]|nr:histidine kinase dimerization/phosphoacceptor domain-containing protein [Nocardioides sp.]
MRISFGCGWQRNASVLLWTPVLLLGPVLDAGGGSANVAFQLGLVAVMAASAVTAVLTSGRSRRDPTPHVALSTLAAATFAGAQHGSEWLPTWILLALTVPSVLRGRWLAGALPVVAAASMWAAWLVEPHFTDRMWSEGFVVLLAGLANTAVLRLIETIEELRRTRQELARRAVAEERERFSRDLHDLLGHTLSVMVVKAEAVRRLVDRDPEAAALHATDIERVGREALVQVREAVDATRALSWATSSTVPGWRSMPPASAPRSRRTTDRCPRRRRMRSPGWCAKGPPTCCGTRAPATAASSSAAPMAAGADRRR